jgi:hypothetical protein
MVATLLILSPIFITLGADEPTFWREFATDIKNADYLFWFNKIPPRSEVISHGVLGLENPLAMSVGLTPISYITQSFNPAVFACWSFFLLAVTMGGLARSSGIDVKWSNLPIVAAGGLMAIVVLNPFLQTEALFSAYRELWIGATFFCALMPLFSKKPLPHGWEVIPTAFVLVFLVGLVPEGIYLAYIVIILWIIRMLIEQSNNFIAIVFALTVLVTLPLMTFWLWYGNLPYILLHIDTSLPEVITSQARYYTVLISGMIIGSITAWASLKIVFCGKCSNRILFVEKAWYVLPATIFIVGIITSSIFGGHWGVKYMLYSQFILLLPVWVWLRRMYDKMWVHNLAFRSPWAVGFFLILIVVGAEFSYKNTLSLKQSYTLDHMKQVSAHIMEQKNKISGRMVVLDGYDAPFHADVMGYELRRYAKVSSIDFLEKLDKNSLHKTLKNSGVGYLWVHRVTEPIERTLSVRLERGYSYLFTVGEFDFRLVTIYPHPSYQ